MSGHDWFDRRQLPRKLVVAVLILMVFFFGGAAMSAQGYTLYFPLVSRMPTPTATLMAAKFVDKSQATPGEILLYTLVVMNDMLTGDDPGRFVVMEDRLPPQVEFIEGTLTGAAVYEAASRTVRWIGQVPRGGSVEVRFQARLTAAAAGMGSVINTVLVTDAWGRQREASAETQVVLAPTSTNTSLPPPPASPTHTPVPSSTGTPAPTATPTQSPVPTTQPTPTATMP